MDSYSRKREIPEFEPAMIKLEVKEHKKLGTCQSTED
jgi:hypothetical protein